MTFNDAVYDLPNSLHDAELLGIRVDWSKRTVRLEFRVRSDNSSGVVERYEVAVLVEGLVFCSVESPARGSRFDPEGRAFIDTGEGFGLEEYRARLPEIPVGTFLQWIFVSQWNSYIHVCGASAKVLTDIASAGSD
ncbi:MAG: hypothetical protein SFV54_11865 [Bryobacteraceae bacterium]|nr:hypothetical protein [Bryobacteraceae bacterium]